MHWQEINSKCFDKKLLVNVFFKWIYAKILEMELWKNIENVSRQNIGNGSMQKILEMDLCKNIGKE